MTKIKDRLRSFRRTHFLRDLFTRGNCYTIMAASRSEAEVISVKSKPIKKKTLGLVARRQKSRQQFKLTKPMHLQKVVRKLATLKKQNGFPMSVAAAQEAFRGLLNNNERREIRDHEEIYWFPVQKRKDVKSTLNIASIFDKYDQESKMDVYQGEVGEHINYRYEIQKVLGQGAFGQVFQCFDHKAKEVVALKVLKKNDPDGPKEVEILKKLRENDPFGEKHIIKMKDSFEFRGHLMLTFEMLNTDLEQFEKSKKGKHLAHEQAKHIAIQLLEALLYLKEEQIIHGDLKLNNIMLKNAQEIYLIDFGFACTEEGQEKTPYEPYQYRAPELLLGEGPYTHSVDMWAYGVILYELHTGSTLFSGDSSTAFLRSMIDILGCPPAKMTSDAVYTRKLFGRNPSRCADIIKGLGPGKLSEKLSKVDYQLADFISKCLEWEPEKRMTPEQAFSHPWIMNGLKTRPDLSTQPQSEWSSTRSQNGADLSNLNSKWTGKLGF